MSTSSLLFPHDFNTTSFLFFSDKELMELATSLSAWPKCIDAGPSNSSNLTTASATIMEVITPPIQHTT